MDGEMWFGEEGQIHRVLKQVWGRLLSALPHLNVVGSISGGGAFLPIFTPLQEVGDSWERGQPWDRWVGLESSKAFLGRSVGMDGQEQIQALCWARAGLMAEVYRNMSWWGL